MARRIIVLAALFGVCACGDAGQGTDVPGAADLPGDPADTHTIDSSPPDTTPETALDTTADTALDAASEATPDTAPETAPDTAPETALDSASDVADADVADVPPDPATCPVPSMNDEYPGPIPPFPYGSWPRAEGCLAQPHDVVIVLGCPSESDGSPSTCQIERARITEQLYDADWAAHFIVTGAAVHNAHVEADALFALLVQRGIPAESIVKEPLAEHTDENLYYATRIMQERGWTSALVVSEDPGHLMMTALCDANCCVDLGRLTLREWEVMPDYFVKAGHYALIPPSAPNTDAECTFIAGKIMCLNIDSRRACKDDFQLGP